MNSTSHTPARKFPFGSGPNAMNNTTLYLTLVASAALGLLFILVFYASRPGNPNPVSSRVPYGVFMSLLPAVCALPVVKLTRIFVSWWGAVIVYVGLFVLTLIVQAYGR